MHVQYHAVCNHLALGVQARREQAMRFAKSWAAAGDDDDWRNSSCKNGGVDGGVDKTDMWWCGKRARDDPTNAPRPG